jgi:hypothetical protein
VIVSHFANDINRYASTMISPYSREGMNFDYQTAAQPSSGIYDAINRTHYFRTYIASAVTIYKLFWLNGATASTNNFQVGLYADDGTNKPGAAALRGTSTLASGANVCQYDNITDTTVGAGIYWLAIWGSGTTATLFRRTGVTSIPSAYYWETNAGGLPATATPVTGAGGAIYMFGLVTRSTP